MSLVRHNNCVTVVLSCSESVPILLHRGKCAPSTFVPCSQVLGQKVTSRT